DEMGAGAHLGDQGDVAVRARDCCYWRAVRRGFGDGDTNFAIWPEHLAPPNSCKQPRRIVSRAITIERRVTEASERAQNIEHLFQMVVAIVRTWREQAVGKNFR